MRQLRALAALSAAALIAAFLWLAYSGLALQRRHGWEMLLLGRQRLLAQQLQTGIDGLRAGVVVLTWSELEALAHNAFETDLNLLRHGGPLQGSPGVRATLPATRAPARLRQLDEIEAAWRALHGALHDLNVSVSDEARASAAEAASAEVAALVDRLDAAATAFTLDVDRRLMVLEAAQAAVLGLGLLLLGLAADRGVLRPLAGLGAAAHRLRHGDVSQPVLPSAGSPVSGLAEDLEAVRLQISAAGEAQVALVDFSRQLLLAADERTVVDEAVALAARLLRCEFSLLALPDAGGRLIVQAVRGWPPEFAGRYQSPSGDQSHVGYTLQQGRPIVVEDYAAPRSFALPEAAVILGLVSGLSAPMVLAGQVVGAMLVQSRSRHHFASSDVLALSLIANQTAVALSKVRLLAAESQRADELEALSATTADILRAAELDRGTLLRLILERAVILAGAAGGDLAIGAENGGLTIVGSYKMGSAHSGTRMAPGEGLLGRVALTRQPMVIDDYAVWEGRSPQFEGVGWRAVMAAPLLAGERLVGAISLADDTPGRVFTPSNLRVLALFAQQAALAMEQARLLEAERQRVAEAETLRRAGAIVASTLDQPQAIALILEQLNVVIPYDSATVQLLCNGYLEVVGGHGWSSLEAVLGVCFPIPGDNPNTIVIQTGQPHILYDAPAEYAVFNTPPQNHVRSWLGVPLIVHEALIGMLAVDSAEPAHFTLAHARLAAAFADQVAIVFENARLYQAAVRAAEAQAILHQAARDISASLEPDQVYVAVHAAAGKLMVCEAFIITLLSPEGASLEAVYVVDRGGRLAPDPQPAHLGLGGHVLRTGQPLLVDDLETVVGLEVRHTGTAPHVRALVAVPLRLGETLLGVLSAQSYTPHAYSQSDLRLLELLAANASIALSNARLFEQVQRLAVTDPLTSLYNRRHFFVLAEREFGRAVRYQRAVALLMVDLDHFKSVNDRYGHPAGDEVLRGVAGRCADNLRGIDVLGRYGGEEFIALLPETDWAGAREAAERVRDAIRATPLPTRAGPVSVTVSIGFAVCTADSADLAALVEHADQALYAAKIAGRDRIEPS